MTPEQAFDKYSQAVFSFAYRLTRQADLAEDIAQECFLSLIRAPERFDAARGTMKTFLFSIARNLSLKHYRDHRTEAAPENEPAALDDPFGALDTASAVAQAVASLPVLQREVVILFEYEGMTLEEIATVVRSDVGAVKSRLHRAREGLRRLLAPYRKAGRPYGTV